MGWVVLFLVVEFVAIFNAENDDTLSEHIWPLLESPWVLVPTILFWIWLGYHFFIEPYIPGTGAYKIRHDKKQRSEPGE